GHFRYSPEPGDPFPDFKTALNLVEAQIKGLVLMDRGFESQGAVLLFHAAIGGDLICNSGRFINPGSFAIWAEGTEIGGEVFLQGEMPWMTGASKPFEADGLLNFEGAQVHGRFIVNGARFIDTGSPPGSGGLDAWGLEVRSGFGWRRVSLENGAQLDLRD